MKIGLILIAMGVSHMVMANDVNDTTINHYKTKCSDVLVKKGLSENDLEAAVLNCVIDMIDIAARD